MFPLHCLRVRSRWVIRCYSVRQVYGTPECRWSCLFQCWALLCVILGVILPTCYIFRRELCIAVLSRVSEGNEIWCKFNTNKVYYFVSFIFLCCDVSLPWFFCFIIYLLIYFNDVREISTELWSDFIGCHVWMINFENNIIILREIVIHLS